MVIGQVNVMRLNILKVILFRKIDFILMNAINYKLLMQNTDNNIKTTDLVPKLPHCAQSPDLDGVIKVVSKISKKTETEIRDMITLGKVTLTAKTIKEIFKELGLDGKWCYNTSYCKASKEGMQKGLLEILTGAYKPSVTIRGDVFEKLVKEKMDAEKKIFIKIEN